MIGLIGQSLMNFSWILLLPMFFGCERTQARALMCHGVTLLLCSLLLWYAFWIADPSLLSVVQYGGQHLSQFYRLVAMWGGHSGSLLLLTDMIALWGIIYYPKVLQPYRRLYLRFYALVVGGVLFIGLLVSSPFELLGNQLGVGMNPLLQDLGMAIHPPILYVGYVSCVVPFLIILADRNVENKHIELIQSVTIWGLFILTFGILLGSWWAYRVLGWGGYWGWDPVESASLLPWVAMLGLYHALLTKDRRWIVLFSLFSFVLSMCSTLLVRSGILASVHTFSSAPNVTSLLLLYGGMVLILALRRVYHNLPNQKVWYPFYYHYIFAVGVILILLILIIVPPIMSVVATQVLVLDAQFIGRLFMPILLLMFVAMSMYHQSTRGDILCCLSIMIIMFRWFDPSQAVVIGVVIYMMLSMRHSSINLTHGLFGLFVILIILNAHLSSYEDIVISPGEHIQQGGYDIQLTNVANQPGDHYIDKVATLLINGTKYSPMIRYYPVSQTSISKVDIAVGFFDEHYVALGAIIGKDDWSLRIHHQLFLRWVWGIGLIAGLSLFRRRN